MANEFKVRKGLVINGSGSALLDVQGSVGQLSTITDSLSGSLFSVNDISGIPIMEAFSDGRVRIGEFGREAIKVSGSFATTTGSLRGTASQALTASYVTGSVYTITNPALYATTASFLLGAIPTFPFIGAATITGSLTVSSSAGNTLFSSNADTLVITGSALITGSLIITGSVLVSGSITVGGSVINNLTASFAQTASFALNAGGSGFPFIGTANITGSLFISSSNASSSLGLRGSGSGVFTVDGTSGRLFSVDDSLSGSLFSVNTAAGLPVIEAFSDNTVRVGQYSKKALFVSQSVVGINKETALNGVLDISGSAVITGSLIVTGSINTIGDISGSNSRFTGTITAQTLVVQTVSSSITYSSGSNIFGNLATNNQVFTGSMYVTGAFYVTTGSVGIGTAAPVSNLHINETSSSITLSKTVSALSSSVGAIEWRNNYASSNVVWARIDAVTLGSTANPWDYSNITFSTWNGFNSLTERMRITNVGNVGIGTSTVSESVQSAGSISIIPVSSVSSGPLIQFAANGRIRPASSTDRLSIDGNPLYLNNTLNTNVVIGGGNLGIGVVPTANWGTTAIQMNHYGSLSSGDDGARAYITMGFGMYDGGSWTPKYVLGGSAASAYRQRDGAHEFYTAGTGTINAAITFTQAMTITSGGNVGIGTSSPGCRLDLVGGNVALNDNKLLIRFASDLNHSLEYNSTYNGPFLYGYAGAALGYLGTGVIWTVNTSYYNYGNTTTWNITSDRRVKQNINALTNAINKISQLNPVSFDYTEEFASDRNWADKHKLNNVGFIAQEYKNVFPDDVNETKEKVGEQTFTDFKNINISSLTPYLVKALQELNQKFEDYKSTHP